MPNTPDKTDNKQDTRFKEGKSGNPNGRPHGSRNKVTLSMEVLLEGEAEDLTRKVIEKAKNGDMMALRICFEASTIANVLESKRKAIETHEIEKRISVLENT